ncbi:MAG TPA: helix-turn-helix transcriptional regulator [Solirubrobacterales bacterium]
MGFNPLETDQAVLEELGSRLRAARLARNLSQAELAGEAGVGRVTLQRVEDGRSASMTNLVRILRALDLLEGLDRLLPPPVPSPVEQLRHRGRQRMRARSSRGPSAADEPKQDLTAKPWQWGDEREDGA